MPDIPQAAIDAARAAYANALYDRPDPTVLSDETLMRIILEAAAPAMAEHAAGRILAHLEAHPPVVLVINGVSSDVTGGHAYRRHFRTAAQIAALAFSTDEDLMRQAAEALARARNPWGWPPRNEVAPGSGTRED
jgi:hypothetical protein